MNVAQTILNQLQMNRPVLWSWGAHGYKSVAADVLTASFGHHLGSLIFKSNGRVRKGHVAICLMSNDTYTLHFGSLRNGQFNVKKSITDVYVEDLHRIIDEEIENPSKIAS